MNPDDLIRVSRSLASEYDGDNREILRQAEACRAVSTTYYAMFHALCNSCADALAGSTQSDRREPAWTQIYRALEHGVAKDKFNNTGQMNRLPAEIRDFGKLFVEMQELRNLADYAPGATFSLSTVVERIDRAEEAIARFSSVEISQRRALATYVLFRSRR